MDFVSPFVSFILKCDAVKQNKLFLNYVDKQQVGIKEIVTSQIDRAQDKEFVDGSVLHKLIFTVFDFKSIGFAALIRNLPSNENIAALLEVQGLINWLTEQNKSKNYPDFGSNYKVERLECSYLSPSAPTFDVNAPEIAKYSIPIVCYLWDYTEAIK